mgnify:CR=1 FL=1
MLESVVAVSQTIFPRDPRSGDPDRAAPGTLWKLRIGLAYRLD